MRSYQQQKLQKVIVLLKKKKVALFKINYCIIFQNLFYYSKESIVLSTKGGIILSL